MKFQIESDGSWEIAECYLDLREFIRAGLQAEEKLTQGLHAFSRRKQIIGSPWCEIVEKFCDDQGLGHGVWVDTFTGLNLLSPHARYRKVGEIVFVQVHIAKGENVGYQKPRVYLDPHDWLYRNAWAVLGSSLDDPGAPVWITDDAGETWQARGECQDLKAFEGTCDINYRGKGKLVVSPDGAGYCPLTGGRLRLGFFYGDPESVPCWR